MTATGPQVRTAADRYGCAARQVLGYLAERFPPQTQGVAILLTFTSIWFLSGRLVSAQIETGWWFGRGLLSFVLLFLEMRLVDDLDDLTEDISPAQAGGSCVMRRQVALKTGITAVTAAVVLLNVTSAGTLLVAAVAAGLVIAAPFVIKRRITRNRLVLAFGYEAEPLMVMLYAYAAWHAETDRAVPAVRVTEATVLYWATYECWKFSRKAGDLAYRPYRLHWQNVRLVLCGLLVILAAAALAVCVSARFPLAFTVYLPLLPLVFLAGTLIGYQRLTHPGATRGRRRLGIRPAYAGAVLAVVLQLSLIAQIGLPRLISH